MDTAIAAASNRFANERHNNFNKTVNRHERTAKQPFQPLHPPAPITQHVDPISRTHPYYP
jgi:hypothetical protein